MEHGQKMELSPHPTVVMRALLIDLDNCPRQIERLPETLTEYVRVIACYGGVEPKVAPWHGAITGDGYSRGASGNYWYAEERQKMPLILAWRFGLAG
jgi:hypothetical protein